MRRTVLPALRVALSLALALLLARPALAGGATPFPPFDGKHVIVADANLDKDAVAAAIAAIEQFDAGNAQD